MSRTYQIRLMFEWGGGSLWCGNEAASRKFDVGPVEDKLPLSNAVLERLNALSQWHDTALDREYPPDPSPWGPTNTQNSRRKHSFFYRSFKQSLALILRSFMNQTRLPVTSGSNRSLRSLGQAKARPLTKR